MKQSILTVNAGSSSIKFALFPLRDPLPEQADLAGQIDAIGTPEVKLIVKNLAGQRVADQALSGGAALTHQQAFDQLLSWLNDYEKGNKIVAVGHRIVHGGQNYSSPIVLNASNLAALTQLTPLAPLHQPHNLNAIHALQTLQPGVPQVACFDTAFHRTQPEIAQRYGLPRKYMQEGARRYGFHGLSYEYIARKLPQYTQRADGRVVIAHLGNGASMSALIERRCIATTLGFSTLDGLLMGTRCGSIDPGLILHLMESKGMGVAELTQLLYKESGLLGVSGISSDMRTLLASDAPEAREAIELFCYRIVRELGSLSAAAGGLDVLVFTGGIGEHNAQLRQNIAQQAAWQGIALDPKTNAQHDILISAPNSAVDVLVIPTNEEWMIAHHTQALLGL